MKKIAIVWLWYVGLPLAYHFAKQWYQITGYDRSEIKLEQLRNGLDSTGEIGEKIRDVSIKFTNNPQDLQAVDVIIVAVPTPLNDEKDPDYTPLTESSATIGSVLKKWQTVIYESTVDPGCTEEICLPILELKSGLKCPQDFKIGYSPERINPGDKEHTVEKICKVVAGIDDETTESLAQLYGSIIVAGVHKASSIKVAEASKIIENTQRDINIAFINEVAQICDRLNIDTFDVLEAAGTKWNFLKFTPWLVGGHCIGVDPYYLAKRARKAWLHPNLILAGRHINDEIPFWVAKQVIKLLIRANKKITDSKVLILGLTFKENVPDFRNSKISDTIRELKDFWIQVHWYDPYSPGIVPHELSELNLLSSELKSEVNGAYDAVIYAQDHQEFDWIDIRTLLNESGVIFDLKGKFRKKGYPHYRSI